jgi:hypothetical protein
MSRQYWSEGLAWQTQDAAAIANTVTESILCPYVTIPANFVQDGRLLRLRAFGKLSTTGTPTMTFSIRLGGVSGVLLAVTEALTMGSGVANVNWSIEAYIQVRSNGATGVVLVFGEVKVHTAAGTVLQNVFSVSGYDAPAGVAVDLTADQLLSLTGTWGTANASNTITGMMYELEALN